LYSREIEKNNSILLYCISLDLIPFISDFKRRNPRPPPQGSTSRLPLLGFLVSWIQNGENNQINHFSSFIIQFSPFYKTKIKKQKTKYQSHSFFVSGYTIPKRNPRERNVNVFKYKKKYIIFQKREFKDPLSFFSKKCPFSF
jgi:hypothetical protein